ncbi:conserved Plasmodium protein, unknown function [Plasmodium relictum]|uniref:Uncharacterized protein n=1 Tax=Plasmodium relictum TaxID=85471 RepID=A0A1J1H4A4_PLARL|nr:conserved Plasmodium protein, unknown function [Plasmodium relictum]CRG99520.1 conserved Plasmodium protein, unknown function [Plasmodium relictum]
MGNCKSYSSHFNVYKSSTNELYENIICNFVTQDKLFFCQKAFVVYEILKKKLENRDVYVYYFVSSIQRKKVKNAVVYLNEDYNVDVLNFFLKLFKKINNEYYNNMFNFHLSSYYNYFFREDTKFTNFSEQMNILENIYNFIRLKFVIENVCLHVYFQMCDNSNEYYEMIDNSSNEKSNNNEIIKGKSNESLQLNKKVMGISIEKKKIINLIKKNFKTIRNFCRNNLHCNMFDNFKMSSDMCLYILLNNYKIKCILYNMFNILIFINNYYNVSTKYGVYKDSETETETENMHSKKLFNDKLIYSLEHRNIYKTYLFICLCLSFDDKNEEDSLFNTHINVNKNEISFTECVSEFLDIYISEKKLNNLFSQEIKEKKKYQCFLNSLQNSYINDSLINSHYICQNQYIKSILNIGNSNYFINNNMMVFCFILFENSLHELPSTNNKSNISDHYSNSFTEINKVSFLKKIRSNKNKSTLTRKIWQKILRNNNFAENVDNNDEDKSEIKDYPSNSDIKKINNIEFDLNNVGFFRIDLYNLRYKSDGKFYDNVENSIKLYTIKKKKNSYIYVKKKPENKADYRMIETIKDNYTHVINVLKTMRNKEICYISGVNDFNESYYKTKKENDTKVNKSSTQTECKDYSCKSERSDKTYKTETININSKNKNYFNRMNSDSKIYLTEENNTLISNENEIIKSNCHGDISQEYEKKFNPRNKLKKPFFIGIHDTFVPFEIENLIFKLKDFYNTDEEIIKKKNNIYKEELHNNMRTCSKQKEHNSMHVSKKEKVNKKIKRNKKNEAQLEKGTMDQNVNTKENSCAEYEHVAKKEDNKFKFVSKKESIFKSENRNLVEQDLVNKLKDEYKEINEEKDKENLNLEEIFNFRNNSDTLNFNEIYENPIFLKLLKNLKNEENLQNVLKNYNIIYESKKIQEFLNKIETYSKKKNNKVMTTNKNNNYSEVFSIDNMETIKDEKKDVNINKKEEKEKEKEEEEEEKKKKNYSEVDQMNVENCEEKCEKKNIDFLKVFIQHKDIGEMSYFVNKKYINISFSMFKVHEGTKKLILSTYINSEKLSPKNYYEGNIDYNITLNKNESFKYIMDLLFLHLNYNRLYFIYIPKKLIDSNNMKYQNNLFINKMCCNCDIILENLYITPGDLIGSYLTNNYISIYFEKINFITIVLLLLFDVIKIYNKIKKLQDYFEGICKKFMKDFHDYFDTKLKKVNYDSCKIKKKNILSIPNELLKKRNVKKYEHSLLSNGIHISSLRRHSNFNEKYISTKEDNNLDIKSLIINVSSTLNSENCTNNINNNNNINGNINNNDNNTLFNNFYLNKTNNENPFDIGYKYKNIYIKIIDLKFYEFIINYINYIKENNSCYYLCPYIFVYKFKSLHFLFIPVCSNFYLIFYLFFFHFLNCSNFFNIRRCFNRKNNHEDISKMNSILPSNNNFLYINNIIKILNVHKNSKTFIKYISLNKQIGSQNTMQYYKWIKNNIIIDIRNSFSSPYFLRTKNFSNFIESTNLHINLKKLYLNKDYMFSFKLDKKNKQYEKFSNTNDIVYMFNHYFNIFTYFYDEKKTNRNKELFYHSKYIIIPYFEDIYISRNNLQMYLKMLQDTSKTCFKSDNSYINQNQKKEYEKTKKEQNNGDIDKEEQVQIHKHSFIYNIYEKCSDIFINYFYMLLNKLILEAVSELKSNNFISISHLLNLLDKYEVNFDIYFWVLYDNYINIYKKYYVHAELVKFFNNNNRNKTYDFDYLKKIKYNHCNKKKFYMRRILIFSVCILVSFICKSIFEFFVINLNYSYEYVLSSICFFFFSRNTREKINDDMYLNILKSIYFNLFLSLSFVLQYIPLSVQYLSLFKIIKKVKKYKTTLSICLNYVCGINLPFYIFYELQNFPFTLLNNFFAFEKEKWDVNVKNLELTDSININKFKENYYDEFNFKINNEKEKIDWINENLDSNISNDSLRFFKSKKVNKKIYKCFHRNYEKNKNIDLINFIIKMNFISCFNIFKFHDIQHSSNNILSCFTYSGLQYFKRNCIHDDLSMLIFSNFVSFMSFWNRSNYDINEYQNSKSFSCSNHDSDDLKKCSLNQKLNKFTIKKKLEYCETNEYLKEPTMLLENYYSLIKVNSDLFTYEYNLKEKIIFDILLKIIEIRYRYLLIILPIFVKENFNLLTDDLKIYLINIFFFIFIRIDKYKIHKRKKKDKIENFSKVDKYCFNKKENNSVFHFKRKNNVLNNKDSDNFLLSSFDLSKDDYFEIKKKEKLGDENENRNEYEYEKIHEIEAENETDYEIDTEADTETYTETGTETDTEIENRKENENIDETYFDNEESSFSNFKDQIKIILLDNYYNLYLIEFFLKIALRIIPFYNIRNKNKQLNVHKSSIIYNLKIIVSFLISFKNIILSMKNNFYVFIYYFFIKGYISLILLNVHRAFKYFKKIFLLIIFFFGNPIFSLNYHPFLIYVTYILYVLTILLKLNMVNFYENVNKREKKMIDGNNENICVDDNNIEGLNNDQLHSNEKINSDNVWLKQKYEIWMYLEIIRKIKRNYIKFNNNIYLVPLNYSFINMKKIFKKHTEEKLVGKYGNINNNKIEKNFNKKKNNNIFLLRELNINDKPIDKNLPININNNFVSLYPTVKNVKVPRVYLIGNINKSFLLSSDYEKEKNLGNHKIPAKIKSNNSKEMKEIKYQNKEKEDNEQLKHEREQKQQNQKERKEKERKKKKKKNVLTNLNMFPINNFPYEQFESIRDENNKSIHGLVDKKDISNLLLYNLIYINKMNRKLNNCNFVFFNFKYCNYKKIISNVNNYYKMILENFKRKLCENYYAYTFGNNEDGILAIGKPSYLKLTPTIGTIGYEKNKKSVKKGTDFWFTNNLQLIPIKIKKICMNENMISIIDKKHNLYISGNNTFIETKNELLFKNKNGRSKDKEKGKNIKNDSIYTNNKIKIDNFFVNLRLKKMKKYEKNYDYNSTSCSSDNLVFGNSLKNKGITNVLNPYIQNEEIDEFYKKNENKNKIMYNSNLCASFNLISDNFSSCRSDILSSFDSEDSDNTYIKVNDKEEINKNMNVSILLKSEKDKSFYVKKKNYSLKKISIDDFNIYNSVLYSSSYANQYLTHILPNQRSSIKSLKRYFKQTSSEFNKEKISTKFKQKSKENVDEEKMDYDEYEYPKKKNLQEQERRKLDKESHKKNGTKVKNEKILLDNNQNNNKFIYNFIYDIKTRIKFIDIFNGSDFVISINNFGHVYSWGNNKYGCLGTGDNINRYAPTLIDPGHFFLYDFEKLQIHTNYKTEIKVKGVENINNRCCENILYNSLILETIKNNIHNKNINSQNSLKESSVKFNEDGKFSNSNNFIDVNKCKDEDFFTLKTDNIYTSEHMFNFENLEIKNITISVHKIYVPISSIFCGNNHVCAYSNGSVFMWGEQKLGQTSIPFENIYFDNFNKAQFSDSDSTYKKNKNEKKGDEKNKNSELLSSSTMSEDYYFHMMHKKKLEDGKNKFNKNKVLFCKKKFSFNVENPIQNYFNITNNDILLNNRKLRLCSNLNSINIKRKKINNDLVLVPVQVCLFNLSYRIKKNENNIDNKYIIVDYGEPIAKSNENLKNTNYNFPNFKCSDDDNNNKINKKTQKNLEKTNIKSKNKSKYVRVYDYLETFIKAEVVNIYMSLFRNDINIYTNIPNNININPYIYRMKFYDYNFYDENYMNVQDGYEDEYDETRYKKEFIDNTNKNLHFSNENDYVVHEDTNKKLDNEKNIDQNEGNFLKSQKNINILNMDDPNKFVQLMKENKIINPQIYEYIEKEETVCINIKLIIFLFLFIKKKYMTIFLNSLMMVSNVSCGEANTVITCFKKSIYDKYYQYIMKNITCSENYKHLENEKLQSKLNLTFPEYDLNSSSEKSKFIYRNDIYDTKNYTSTIVNWGDKSFDEYNIMNSTLSCSDTSRFSRMIEEILANYMCIYVCGRDTNNNLCINNINQSVYTFTRITNNFFYYNFNYFLFLYKYNYYLYYIHKNNVHISHNNDITYIQNNPLTSFKNKFNTFTTKENNINVTSSKAQGVSPNKFIIIKRIVCSNTVTCLVDTYNNVYMAGDVKYYFPNFFHHIAYASSPFIKINLNNTKTIKNISFNQNNIFLIYDDHSFEILGYNDYIDFFKYIHPIFFTNKYRQKHSYNMLKIQNSDFLVKQVQTGNNCAVFVMKKKKPKRKIKKSIKYFN